MSTIKLFGIICFSAFLFSTHLPAQLTLPPGVTPPMSPRNTPLSIPTRDASWAIRAPSRCSARPGKAQWGKPFASSNRATPRRLRGWPDTSANHPISGVVSLHELEHPVPKKAIREAHEAERFSRANDIPKAIAKLENAIRIDPSYRDAHVNLGVQYARSGRVADARRGVPKGSRHRAARGVPLCQ